jgi:hypothetical protein
VQQIKDGFLHIQEKTTFPVFVDLLRDHSQAADAQLAGRLLEPSTASRIWHYLLRESSGKQFFYSEKSNDQVRLRDISFQVLMTDTDRP